MWAQMSPLSHLQGQAQCAFWHWVANIDKLGKHDADKYALTQIMENCSMMQTIQSMQTQHHQTAFGVGDT
jgi:hypothetical protein